MAIEATGAIYKSLYFDGVDSRGYGVYITGQAVYNAPEREVEMISIPGRNGQLALDKGRFENIEVTYPAGIYAETEADFAEAISNFRNLLCSRRGYVRLQDEYNPNEYRLAIYKSGLEVETALLRAGEFEIVFDCKPQRWLTSGETAIEVDSGDVISNPTLFEASPLLEVTGFGDLEFNGYTITISGEYIGQVNTGKSIVVPQTYSNINESISDNFQYANVGDEINLSLTTGWALLGGTNTFTNINISSSGDFPNPLSQVGTTSVGLSIGNYAVTFNYQTARTLTGSVQVTGNVGGTAFTVNTSITLSYDGANTISAQITHTISTSVIKVMSQLTAGSLTYNSTQSTLGNPLYIDCDLGEAYKIEGGTLVSINDGVNLGSDLPTLAPGANTITFDNTVSDLKITPRWWKI